jgi:CRISPR-associated endonuclease/helicase Cas3
MAKVRYTGREEKTVAERAKAHVRQLPDGSWAEPHWLDEHLEGTARLAESFACKFGSGAWGRALGLLHDVGKGRDEWQRYLEKKSGWDEEGHLEGKSGKLDHSSPGAKLAEELYGRGIGRFMAYCIAGHHAGLPDWTGSQAGLGYRKEA